MCVAILLVPIGLLKFRLSPMVKVPLHLGRRSLVPVAIVKAFFSGDFRLSFARVRIS